MPVRCIDTVLFCRQNLDNKSGLVASCETMSPWQIAQWVQGPSRCAFEITQMFSLSKKDYDSSHESWLTNQCCLCYFNLTYFPFVGRRFNRELQLLTSVVEPAKIRDSIAYGYYTDNRSLNLHQTTLSTYREIYIKKDLRAMVDS